MGSGFKTFTAGAVLTASDVNNYLMEQGVMYFASTTARDAAITAPERGMTAYIGSNDASEGLYSYNGTSWRKGPGWNAPWGLVVPSSGSNPAQATSDQGSITTVTDITSLSVTWNAVSNRNYLVTIYVRVASTVANDVVQVQITDGSNNQKQQGQVAALSATPLGMAVSVILTGLSGSTTMKGRIVRAAGTGTVSIYASSTSPAYISVEDIGPSGAPA